MRSASNIFLWAGAFARLSRQSKTNETKSKLETNFMLFIFSLCSSSNSDDRQRWRHLDRHPRWRRSHAAVPLQSRLLRARIHLLLGPKLSTIRKRCRRREITEFHLQVSSDGHGWAFPLGFKLSSTRKIDGISSFFSICLMYLWRARNELLNYEKLGKRISPLSSHVNYSIRQCHYSNDFNHF